MSNHAIDKSKAVGISIENFPIETIEIDKYKWISRCYTYALYNPLDQRFGLSKPNFQPKIFLIVFTDEIIWWKDKKDDVKKHKYLNA